MATVPELPGAVTQGRDLEEAPREHSRRLSNCCCRPIAKTPRRTAGYCHVGDPVGGRRIAQEIRV